MMILRQNEFDFYNGGGLKRRLADFIYPNRCPFCDDFIPYDRVCCEECFNKIPWTTDTICTTCGKPKERCICPVPYSGCITAALYREPMIHGIVNMKFRFQPDTAMIFGRIIADRLRLSGFGKIDLIVPVPVSKGRKAERGYNQSGLIAEEISKITEVPVKNVLVRREHNTAQHLLSAEERQRAAAEQFAFSEGSPALSGTVLLVDDVLTTGATLCACTKILLEHGAERVFCCAAATV